MSYVNNNFHIYVYIGALYQEHGSLGEAIDLYTQGANVGEPMALTCLAWLLLEGNGVERDAPRAIELLITAASLLESSAFFLLGRVVEEGLGVNENVEAARHMYELSAQLGHAAAAAALARLYADGMGVDPDGDKALSWAKRASDNGFDWAGEAEGTHSAGAAAEYAALKTPLKGGRPSRYHIYIYIYIYIIYIYIYI
jgi:TPR repeat protein